MLLLSSHPGHLWGGLGGGSLLTGIHPGGEAVGACYEFVAPFSPLHGVQMAVGEVPDGLKEA